MTAMKKTQVSLTCIMGAAAAGAAAYMLFESQWVERRERTLTFPTLPEGLEGLTILHLSDIHAAQPGLNLWTLAKAVAWAKKRRPDLVVLTGDVLGGNVGTAKCLHLLAELRPPLGMFAVAGNHEYGLARGLAGRCGLAGSGNWGSAESPVRYLRDECVLLKVAGGEGAPAAALALCGADYITRGHGLRQRKLPEGAFPVLLTHRPPNEGDPLVGRFPLILAGHTHGGQIRLPTPWGLVALHRDDLPFLEGVHEVGGSTVVISRGVGCTFLPLRLCSRPQAELLRLASGKETVRGGKVSSSPGMLK